MPRTENGLIRRSKLMSNLDALTDEKIVFICAPAGFGKTVAVRQWLDRSECVGAVITLDEYDNKPHHFCRGFCTALYDCQPKNNTIKKILKHPAFDGASVEFTVRAIAALKNIGKVRLVIDDLHFICDEKLLHMLTGFLKQLPESFQIILISRNELPSCFLEQFPKVKISCVTTDDLRFSCEDIMTLYEKRGSPISYEKADEIFRFTDGWAIAIGALLLSDGELHGDSIECLDEFICANIWQRWDEPTREFMLKTSIVSELTPPLCAALTDEPDCKTVLERLVCQNAFITRTKPGVYRYHRLFSSFLSRMLAERGKKYYRNLLNKVGYWCLTKRDFYSSMDYFTKSENTDGILKCFDYLSGSSSEFASIEKLITVSDSSLVLDAAKNYPHIYAILVWIAFNKGRAADMAYYADQYYKHQTMIIWHDPRFASASILILLIDFRNSLSDLKRAIPKIFLLAIRMKLNGVEADLGVMNQNMPFIHRGTRDVSESAIGDIEANVLLLKKILRGLLGGYGVMFMECLTAGLMYEQGNLKRALSHALLANAEICEHFSAEAKFIAMSTHVCILDALARNGEADKAVKRIADMIEQENAYYLSFNFNAMETRRKLAKEDTEAAREWLAKYEPLPYDDPVFYKLYGHLTTCRAYIAEGSYDSAVILLKKILVLAEAYNRPLDIIETLILLSIAYKKKKHGFQTEAVRCLEQAVKLAYTYRYTQLFVSEGAELAGTLLHLQKRLEQYASDNALLVNFIKSLRLKVSECFNSEMISEQSETSVMFTKKQIEVMKLLCEGNSYREISGVLGISRPTLRSHIAAIYYKLHVTNEVEAIKKIKSMKLLSGIE